MLHRINRYLSLFIIFALVLAPLSASAGVEFKEDKPDVASGKMAADAVLVRPLGIVATVLGGALFVVSLPFSALGGNTKEAADRLVVDPAKFTFARPLGKF